MGIRTNTRQVMEGSCDDSIILTSEPEICRLDNACEDNENANADTNEDECTFTEWQLQHDCTQTCGGGYTSKTRSILNGVEDCGPLELIERCNDNVCNGNDNVGDDCVGIWEDLSPCSRECGGGVIDQRYSVDNEKNCEYSISPIRTKACNTQECHTNGSFDYVKFAGHTCKEGKFIQWNGDETNDEAPIYNHSLDEVKEKCNQYGHCVSIHENKALNIFFMKSSGETEISKTDDLYIKYIKPIGSVDLMIQTLANSTYGEIGTDIDGFNYITPNIQVGPFVIAPTWTISFVINASENGLLTYGDYERFNFQIESDNFTFTSGGNLLGTLIVPGLQLQPRILVIWRYDGELYRLYAKTQQWVGEIVVNNYQNISETFFIGQSNVKIFDFKMYDSFVGDIDGIVSDLEYFVL
jgi:hypothetical protein